MAPPQPLGPSVSFPQPSAPGTSASAPDTSEYAAIVRDRLSRVAERIAEATGRSGRPSGSVRVVAVAKGHPPAAIEAALGAGVADIGENRVEELETKASLFRDRGVRWHMIGHVQSRKATRAFALGGLIHSVDSLRLAGKLSRIAEAAGRKVRILVQANLSGEATKGGFGAEAALDGIGAVSALPGLRVEGLMTMAPFTSDEGAVRAVFGRAREIAAAASAALGTGPLELSMGMSNDYVAAVEEGSTMVRLGTALLGRRPG